MALTLAVCLVLVLIALGYVMAFVGRRERHLPPGPPTLPVLGNLHQIPLKRAHLAFTSWSKQYGGIYTLKLGTGTAVVFTDRRLVRELLDKRSLVYSERPKSYVASLISAGDHVLLMDYGQQWRSTRKLLHTSLMAKTVDQRYLPLQEAECRQMIRDFLAKPDHHMTHPKRFSNSVTMAVVWGIRSPTMESEHLKSLYSLLEIWASVMETGATPPVDIYPMLHYVPQTLFGNWRDRATHVQKSMDRLYASFLADIRTRRALSGSRGSIMDQVLDQAETKDPPLGMTYSDHELWFLGGTLTEGGSDTTASVITAFVQAMLTNPDAQRKAQAEIDSLVGPERSPTWEDYSALPYVVQCVKETTRWRPVAPLAFPHALARDDWVEGYRLPRGATIIINTWGLHHDASRYKNPEVFDPAHFAGCTGLASDLANGSWEQRDHYGYGAGRRMCPAIHLAERNLFLAIAKLLWAFEILPAVDEDRGGGGHVVLPDIDPGTGYHEGLVVRAHDFPARFVVRGKERAETVAREFAETEGVLAGYE